MGNGLGEGREARVGVPGFWWRVCPLARIKEDSVKWAHPAPGPAATPLPQAAPAAATSLPHVPVCFKCPAEFDQGPGVMSTDGTHEPVGRVGVTQSSRSCGLAPLPT
jgi:hypothetical protein